MLGLVLTRTVNLMSNYTVGKQSFRTTDGGQAFRGIFSLGRRSSQVYQYITGD